MFFFCCCCFCMCFAFPLFLFFFFFFFLLLLLLKTYQNAITLTKIPSAVIVISPMSSLKTRRPLPTTFSSDTVTDGTSNNIALPMLTAEPDTGTWKRDRD